MEGKENVGEDGSKWGTFCNTLDLSIKRAVEEKTIIFYNRKSFVKWCLEKFLKCVELWWIMMSIVSPKGILVNSDLISKVTKAMLLMSIFRVIRKQKSMTRRAFPNSNFSLKWCWDAHYMCLNQQSALFQESVYGEWISCYVMVALLISAHLVSISAPF